jgi:hypothetical protein
MKMDWITPVVEILELDETDNTPGPNLDGVLTSSFG